jgi:ribosomal peptide maturation radical SAM protein 1
LKRIGCVDNILDLKYLNTLFPKLKQSGLNLELFYEVKANLRREQLAVLRDGGVRAIQPGIESFSDEVLRLMRKGCTGFQNIQLLRWSKELGIEVAWNLLAGFPGESPGEYDRMARMVPLLTHLSPPVCCTPVRLDRFSPFFSRPQDFGFTRVRPAPAYFYVFPLGRRELSRLAYFFDFDYGDGRNPDTYLIGLQREVGRWWNLQAAVPARRPKLDAEFTADGLVVTDTREVASAARHHLTGIAAEVYARCDSAQTIASLLRQLPPRSEELVLKATLRALRNANLVFEEGEQFVSLAVFRNRPEKDRTEQSHVCTTISKTPSSEQLLYLV